MAKTQLNFTNNQTNPNEELRRKMDVEDEYKETYNKEFKALNDKYLQTTQQTKKQPINYYPTKATAHLLPIKV